MYSLSVASQYGTVRAKAAELTTQRLESRRTWSCTVGKKGPADFQVSESVMMIKHLHEDSNRGLRDVGGRKKADRRSKS